MGFAPVIAHDDLSRAPEAPCSRVVPQPLPLLENGLLRCCCQASNRWKAGHPSLKVRERGLDARLLQHYFRDPDGVRVPAPTPGQIAGIPRVPLEHVGCKAASRIAPPPVLRAGLEKRHGRVGDAGVLEQYEARLDVVVSEAPEDNVISRMLETLRHVPE